MRVYAVVLAAPLLLSACQPAPVRDLDVLTQQVMDAEHGFARSMADRDHDAFRSFLADETVFFNGDEATRGRDAVSAAWKRYFDSPVAPFSWAPDHVEVLDSGTLALTTGPVHNPAGELVGRFNSIWRLEPSGQWRIVFDKDSPVCP